MNRVEYFNRLSQLNPSFDSDDLGKLSSLNVIIVGAGGIGCEILKCLVMSGFQTITLVDMDTIENTNLNRQFLFRDSDIGKFKAQVAIERLYKTLQLMPGIEFVKLRSLTKYVQDIPIEEFAVFDIFVMALDNIGARRYINSAVLGLGKRDEKGILIPETIKPIIDGGTEGFNGQVRLIAPPNTACYDCTLWMTPSDKKYPICTLAETPRLPEHCIAYVKMKLWNEMRHEDVFDADNPEHLEWIFEQAISRAQQYNIQPFTRHFTLGIIKNIIPALSSTNSLISAIMSNIVLFFAIYHLKSENHVIDDQADYLMIRGLPHLALSPVFMFPNEDCTICSPSETLVLAVNATSTVEELLNLLKEDQRVLAVDPLIANIERKCVYNCNKALVEHYSHLLQETLHNMGIIDTKILLYDKSRFKPQMILLQSSPDVK